ncbi:11361_t:CDS:1 [Diversispora eburnea]|uniref:11361_t:CDS:1 n=1 Tax=Diversispora eburnea TaxID=1213867 RepID=A0A9N8UZ63_9GLOM|nr:11361_t:CDS:1 [Diversispora eburnea]
MSYNREMNEPDLQNSQDIEYLAFLERISQQAQQLEAQELDLIKTKEEEDPTTYPPDVQRIRSDLLEASSQLRYISEGEEPYEFVFIPNDEINCLPETSTEFSNLVQQSNANIMTEDEKGTVKEEEPRVLTFQEFFEKFTGAIAEDPYGQKEGYKELQKIVEAIFGGKENVKIYKVGVYRRIGVYIVGLIKGVGITGLKTFSIET